MEEPRHQQQQQHRGVGGGSKQVLELPQWNSKFGFAAQKHPTQQPPAAGGNKGPLQATPGRLGQARRVPVAAAAPGAKHGQENQGPSGAGAPSKAAATSQDPEKTPTLCLFERFERLTLVTPSTAAPNTTATAAAGLGHGLLSSAAAPRSAMGSAGSTTSSTGSEQCVARVKPARRSVAFGTPSVLAYTPAQTVRQEAADCRDGDDRTPLWSNAGHTPYSLPGSTGSSGRILEDDDLDPEQQEQEEENSTDSTALPLITASGIPRVCAGGSSSSGRPSHSSGVRMELFTSVIHEVTEEEGQVTPAGAAALRCPKTPAGVPVVEQADSTGAGASPTGVAGELGSDCDEGSECDMEMLTPATMPFSARLQRAAAGGSTAKTTPVSSSKPAARTPGRSAAAAGGRATGSKAARAGTASHSAAAAAAGADSGSPSGASAFTGFAGGSSTVQQAGSTTPTFFDGSRRAGCSSKAAASSSLQNLLAGSSTATSRATPSAPASAARVGANRSTARASAPVWVPAGAPGSSSKRTPARTPVAKTPSSRAAAAATPATDQRPQRTPATAAAGASAAKAASSRAAVTPGARQQRTLDFGAAAAERGPAAAAAAACAAAASSSSAAAAAVGSVGSDEAEVFSSPPASMRPPPAMTPRSKLRQPERVAVEARTPKPTAELHKLLDDADAAAAAAAVLAAGAGGQQEQAMLVGSCEVLSPVRARKHAQHTLGAAEQVCTPVRRSARKLRGVAGGVGGGTPSLALVGGGVLGGSSAPGAAAVVQPMLEATNYCYQPNEALQK